jgi:type I restriction enzyme S subunit
MQVRRDKKMPVAILKDYDEAIISQAYPVFRVVDETKLLPDYLMMWMRREEFDREACFLAVGGVRGSLEWEDFLNMELPVPPIEKQREIVAEYNTVVDRIELNEQINQKLEETAKAIYRYWFEEFEFPISKEYAESIGKPELEGKPYKSSDGEMVYNQELEEEIPKGWERISIQDLIDRNLIHPNRDGNHGELHPKSSDYVDQGIPFIMANDIVNSAIDFENCKFIPKEISDNLRIPPSKKGDVLITHKGTMGRVTIVPEIDIPIVLTPQVTFYRVKQKKKITKEFLYWLNPLNTGQCFC